MSSRNDHGVPGDECTDTYSAPQRVSPRAEFHDYSGGEYFITICTCDKKHYFGKIRNGEMLFTPMGKVAQQKLQEIPSHYSYAEIPLFTVMPNHIHVIVRITDTLEGSGQLPKIRTALSAIIGSYKQAVTMHARRNNIDFAWQSRYHDHIIRGQHDRNKIATYIENNVATWDADCYNGPLGPIK